MSDENLNRVIADYADAVSAMGEEIRSLKMDKDRLTAALAAAEAKGRREGAEAAAKVVEPFRKSENGSVRYAATIITERISALYPEVAPHQEKETR